MRFYNCLLLVTVALFSMGCCSTPNACGCRVKKAPKSRPIVHDSYEGYEKTYKILITSNPPGARIYVNNKEIGTAPAYHTVTVNISPNAYKADFAIYDPVELNIVAYPAGRDQYTQEKTLTINPDDLDTVPARVAFDMSIGPERPRYTAGHKY